MDGWALGVGLLANWAIERISQYMLNVLDSRSARSFPWNLGSLVRPDKYLPANVLRCAPTGRFFYLKEVRFFH